VQSTGNISDKILCGVTQQNTPLAVSQIRQIYHWLLRLAAVIFTRLLEGTLAWHQMLNH
jgi:hypothetical protein